MSGVLRRWAYRMGGLLARDAVYATIAPRRNTMGWKTITGAVVWVIGQLSNPEFLAIFPDSVAKILTTVGAFLAAIGLRHAIAKSGNGR